MAGKKGLLIGVVAVLVLGVGGTGFAAFSGIITIPGITPKKVAKKAANLYGETGADPVAKEAEKPKPKPPVAPPKPKKAEVAKEDPALGNQKVADVWSSMSTEAIIAVIKNWKDEEVAPVLALMEDDKTGELLSQLSPERASSLSQKLRKFASQLPAEGPG